LLERDTGNVYLTPEAMDASDDDPSSERTMRMSTPFEGRPDDYGILTMSQEEIDTAVEDAIANGFRIGIHANGDVTIDMVLKAYEKALAGWEGPNPRLRLEHYSLVNPDLLERIKKTGSIRKAAPKCRPNEAIDLLQNHSELGGNLIASQPKN
jgi:hypothetical protein